MISHVKTIEENAKFLTPKEITQANVAEWLLHALGNSPVLNLKTIIKSYVTVVLATLTVIATINALSQSDGIQNLKITNLHRHLLFDSSVDPALLAGGDDTDDKDTSFAGVHDKDTSFAGVPVPKTTIEPNADDNSDTGSNHNSIDPNEANNN